MESKEIINTNGQMKIIPDERPDTLPCSTAEVPTGCGKLYITVGFKGGKPFEVFGRLGKGGGCPGSQIEAICRGISLAMRCHIDMRYILKQYLGIRCPREHYTKHVKIWSCADGIAKGIGQIINMEHFEIHGDQGVCKDQEMEKNALLSNGILKVRDDWVCPACQEPLDDNGVCFNCTGNAHMASNGVSEEKKIESVEPVKSAKDMTEEEKDQWIEDEKQRVIAEGKSDGVFKGLCPICGSMVIAGPKCDRCIDWPKCPFSECEDNI
jgi:hypothetical protein